MLTNEERQILQNYHVDIDQQLARRQALPTWMIEAYRTTRFRVHAGTEVIELVAGQCSAPLDEWLLGVGAGSWAFITAWNPRSEQLSLEENTQRQKLLCQELEQEGLSWVREEGVSEDGQWREPSVLIANVAWAWAEALGMRYEQNAIVVGRPHSAAALLFTEACLPKRPTVQHR